MPATASEAASDPTSPGFEYDPAMAFRPMVGIGLVLSIGCGRLGFDSQTADGIASDQAADSSELELLLDRCLVRMSMDESEWTGAAGEVEDSCGGHHGTASGGATTSPDGVRGRAGLFAGDPGCVQITDASMLQPTGALTASAWLFPTALSPNSFGVLSRRDSFGVNTSYSVFIWLGDSGGTTNQLYVDIDGENDRVANPNAAFLDEWHQITVVYDGALATAERVRFYVDGAPSFTAPETSSSIAPGTGSPPLSIGCLPLGSPAQSFIGRLDEVVLWERALTGDEVARWYAATKP